jgi:hypothetical protein
MARAVKAKSMTDERDQFRDHSTPTDHYRTSQVKRAELLKILESGDFPEKRW